MVARVWKYDLAVGDNVLVMPAGAAALSVGVQRDRIRLWASVDTDQRGERRTFFVVGTGWTIGDRLPQLRFIGTVQCGTFAWHVFEDVTA